MINIKKTALAVAIATAMGVSATASADVINVSFDGLFTLFDSGGKRIVTGFSGSDSGPWYGNRTPITGTMSFDTDTGAGTGAFGAFSFFGKGLAAATSVSFQAIGNGFGGPGPLMLADMGFKWTTFISTPPSSGTPISLVWDASGFFSAIGAPGGVSTSDTIAGGVTAASEGTRFGLRISYTLPMGPGPMVTTTWNTTTIGGAACTLGCNPSGTLPLIADTVGGSPAVAGPFASTNFNFDIMTLQVDTVTSAVPVPAAVWLFGSGLIGLIGIARKRRR